MDGAWQTDDQLGPKYGARITLHVQALERIITGQNCFSSADVAQAIIDQLARLRR
ncbi:hypothetical protein LJ739_07740 [Aestuariibacter halophilus]|uniref:Uncharacterized protein n=1 Tax=Fluctibacter halophilus TaxID=226011 RepID=A0ABS8G6A6_9ALTE|nr:hypothetical protein [Aestuariibacter halophilus]MCC2616127.1 hypothetical protein [Aestuariibacter halophilus]